MGARTHSTGQRQAFPVLLHSCFLWSFLFWFLRSHLAVLRGPALGPMLGVTPGCTELRPTLLHIEEGLNPFTSTHLPSQDDQRNLRDYVGCVQGVGKTDCCASPPPGLLDSLVPGSLTQSVPKRSVGISRREQQGGGGQKELWYQHRNLDRTLGFLSPGSTGHVPNHRGVQQKA